MKHSKKISSHWSLPACCFFALASLVLAGCGHSAERVPPAAGVVTDQSAVPSESGEAPLPAVVEGPGKPLRELSANERSSLAERGTLAMNEAWQEAAANVPPGMAFVRGDLYMVLDSVRNHYDSRQDYARPIYSFYMGSREVTQKEFSEIVGYNPSACAGDELPVQNVSWYDAIAYCNKRSVAEGLTPYYRLYLDDTFTIFMDTHWNEVSGKDYSSSLFNDDDADGYRLPDERQWEYAARGGLLAGADRYSGGDTAEAVGWVQSNSGGAPHPVGEKTPNVCGLYDMTGNVAEWVDTRSGYWNETGIRGGSFHDATPSVRQSVAHDIGYADSAVGFRVIRPIPRAYRRFAGLTFSPNLRVRTAPGTAGDVVDALPSLTPIAVYETSGSGVMGSDGTLDLWFRIGENRWINAYYVALLPFFTRSTGRIDVLSELDRDITDCPDVREIPFQFFWLDGDTRQLRSESAGDEGYYCRKRPLYGMPVAPPVRDIRPFFGDGASRLNARTYARFVEDSTGSDRADIPDCRDARWFIDGQSLYLDVFCEGPDEYVYSIEGTNTLSFNDESYDVFEMDSRTLMIRQEKNGSEAFSFLRSNLPYSVHDIVSGERKLTKDVIGAYDAGGASILVGLIDGCYDSVSARKDAMWPLAKRCVKEGVPVNYADYSGMTALHYAAMHWDDRLISFLLDHGANPRFKNMDGAYPRNLVSEMHWGDNPGTEESTRSALRDAY